MKETNSSFLKPSTPSIEAFWLAENPSINVSSITIPFLHHELILNCGDVFTVSNASAKQNILFSNIQTDTIQTHAKGNHQALGILFNPVGAYQTYGVSMAEVKAQCNFSPSDLLFGKQPEIIDLLQSTIPQVQKLSELNFMFQQYSADLPCPKIVECFINSINGMSISPMEIKKMAWHLNCTSKHLINSFKDVVGITPKKFLSIKQINAAVKNMWLNPKKNLTQVALESGFYDQSHFIRVFKKLSRYKPTEFRHIQSQQGVKYPNTILV